MRNLVIKKNKNQDFNNILNKTNDDIFNKYIKIYNKNFDLNTKYQIKIEQEKEEKFNLDCESKFSILNKGFLLDISSNSEISLEKISDKKIIKFLDHKNIFNEKKDNFKEKVKMINNKKKNNFKEKVKMVNDKKKNFSKFQKNMKIYKRSKSCSKRTFLIEKNSNIFEKTNSELSIFCLDNNEIILQNQFNNFQNLFDSVHLEFKNTKKNKTKQIFDLVTNLKENKFNKMYLKKSFKDNYKNDKIRKNISHKLIS